MIPAPIPSQRERGERTAMRSATRAQLGVVALMLAGAGAAWWSTAERMTGMDAGPGTALGSLGWFTGVWAVMMAAMMLPSLAPTAAVYAALTRSRRKLDLPLLFAAGYLLVWCAAGVVAYALFAFGKSLFAHQLAWHAGGRWLTGGVLALAALYELTPLKHACLQRCRRPLRFLRDSWREGRGGALIMGVRNGGWCLGCSWALMGALFALGVMSLTWMGLVAVLVALQKLAPWRRATLAATAALLLVFAVAVLLVPHAVPGLVVPGDPTGMMHS